MRPARLGFLALLVASCGGGGSPAGPSGPPATTLPPGNTVAVQVFYDEDGDGQVQGNELVRIPNVGVTIGGRSAQTQATTGIANVAGVPAGDQAVTLQVDTLPPYYAPRGPVSIHVPQTGGPLPVSVVLPLGRAAQPKVYMAFGDSITKGIGASTPSNAWGPQLEQKLGPYFGQAQVISRGADGTDTNEGRDRLIRNINADRPAYVLILYGTNDWNTQPCQSVVSSCPTIDNLRVMVQRAHSVGSLVVLGTIPPANPAINADRNIWVEAINGQLKTMASQEQVVVADVYAEFTRRGNLPSLFFDHVHPNDAGHEIIAQAFFDAIAHGHI